MEQQLGAGWRDRLGRTGRVGLGALGALLFVGCGQDEGAWWDDVRNPFLGFEERAIKDNYAVFHDGVWHLGYSSLTDDPFRVRIGTSRSADLLTFEHDPVFDLPEAGGVAAPEVVRAPDGRFVMTFNTHTRDVGDAVNKLYYRTSDDLVTWSAPTRFVVNGADAPEDRLIDAALAFHGGQAWLFYKRQQVATVAHAPSGQLDGPWFELGPLSTTRLENFQPFQFEDQWYLLATTIPLVHRPLLLRLDGDPSVPESWRTWTELGVLEVEEKDWNTGEALALYERSNSAHLGLGHPDGHLYLFYAGSTEVQAFERRGHSSLGVARSPDLWSWEVAPAR